MPNNAQLEMKFRNWCKENFVPLVNKLTYTCETKEDYDKLIDAIKDYYQLLDYTDADDSRTYKVMGRKVKVTYNKKETTMKQYRLKKYVGGKQPGETFIVEDTACEVTWWNKHEYRFTLSLHNPEYFEEVKEEKKEKDFDICRSAFGIDRLTIYKSGMEKLLKGEKLDRGALMISYKRPEDEKDEPAYKCFESLHEKRVKEKMEEMNKEWHLRMWGFMAGLSNEEVEFLISIRNKKKLIKPTSNGI